MAQDELSGYEFNYSELSDQELIDINIATFYLTLEVYAKNAINSMVYREYDLSKRQYEKPFVFRNTEICFELLNNSIINIYFNPLKQSPNSLMPNGHSFVLETIAQDVKDFSKFIKSCLFEYIERSKFHNRNCLCLLDLQAK